MKPLKILLGNQTYNLLAGSETWSKTLAYQLQKAGHSVEAFSPQLGIISNEMVKKGIKCLDRIFTSGIMPFSIVLEEKNAFDYDVIIANHTDIVYHLRSQFPSTPIISTIHGVLHCQDYDLESIIIRNFFDIDSLQPKRNINPIKPSTFLVNTNYSLSNDPDVEVIRKVSKHYGAKLVAIGQNFSLNPNVMQAIEEADIVVGMGRSVLEGVCAGRLGIVHGRWGTGGIICKESIVDIQKCNFSGRNSKGVFYTVEQMISEIDKHYNQNTIEWGVQYVKVNHNVVTAADMFVTIARELLGQSTSETPLEIIRPYSSARDVN